MTDISAQEPWYKEGLKFKCTQCGECCTGAPGYIWVTEEEIQKMAEFKQMSLDAFCATFVKKVNGKLSLLEHSSALNSNRFDCVFLKDKKCSIHPVRPTQCRTFPWWPSHLKSPQTWKNAAKQCEGIDHPEAELTPFSVIQEELQKQMDSENE
jgi:Fe-S-cluster containining protein